MADLDGVYAKLARASEHHDALYQAVEGFFESKPYEITDELDASGTEYVGRFYMRRPFDPRLATLIGDCLFNVRSALDHLAWALASRHGPPPRSTEFPIFIDENKFHAFEKDGVTPKRGSGLAKIAGIRDPEARANIAALQPYKGWAGSSADQHPLWLINELNRVDKHQLLLVVATRSRGTYGFGDPDYTGDPAVYIDHAEFASGPLPDGAPFARIKVRPPQSQMHMQVNPALTIAFEEGQGVSRESGETLFDVLWTCRNFAGFAVERFRKHFP